MQIGMKGCQPERKVPLLGILPKTERHGAQQLENHHFPKHWAPDKTSQQAKNKKSVKENDCFVLFCKPEQTMAGKWNCKQLEKMMYTE